MRATNKGMSQSIAMIIVATLSSIASIFIARAQAQDQTTQQLNDFRVQNAVDIGQVKTDLATEVGAVKTSVAAIQATQTDMSGQLKSLDRNYSNLAGSFQSFTSALLNSKK